MSDTPPSPRSLPVGQDSWTYSLDATATHAGAQGVVHYGSRSDSFDVAVKIAGESPSQEQSLHHEIGMLKALGAAHVQGVAQCLDVIDVQGRVGMVMPRYPSHMGIWLRSTIDNPGSDTLDEVLSRVATVARILANVHRVPWAGQTVIHRDIKPENVFQDEQGRMVLGDFGGAMAISGLKAVELALFGSPMYAPLDQILPGTAIPDTTWDTYGLCVILYAALTGSRPAYQADPRSLLTAKGRDLWELASQAIDAEGGQAQKLRVAFAQARIGTTAADLVDVTGHSSLNVHDQQLLNERVLHLCQLASVPQDRVRLVQQGFWTLLSRGLSPVSHPSPPNRFRNADALAEQLEDLRDLLSPTPQRHHTPPAPLRQAVPESDPIKRSWMSPWPLVAIAALLLIAAAVFVVVRFTPETLLGVDTRVRVPPSTVQLQHHRPPETALELVGLPAEVRHDRLRWTGGPIELRAHLEAASASTVFVVRDSQGTTVFERDAGTQPAGVVLETWQPPSDLEEGVYNVQIAATLGDRVISSYTIVRATASGVQAGKPVYAGVPLPLDHVRSWTSTVSVPAFQIDRTEVRSVAWDRCAAEGVCRELPSTNGSHPALGVAMDDATTYCRHMGGAVPTEAQWLAAYGPERYPWGDQRPTCQQVHGAGCSETPAAVGLLPEGASRDGVFDLAGNAWEWVQEGDGGANGVLIGGSVQSQGGAIGRGSRVDPTQQPVPAWSSVRCVYNEKVD